MASSSGIFLWITVSGTGEVVEKTAEEATSLLLQGTFDPGMSARLAGDERTATLSALLEWLDFVHGTRLQLTGRIDTETVRASFRKLSRQYHPDHTETLGPDLQALAERRFKEINESKSYLLARLDSGLDSLVVGSDVAEPRIPPPAVSTSLAPSPAASSRDRGFRDDGKKRRTTALPRQAMGKFRRGYLGPLAAIIGLVALFLWIGHFLETGPPPPVVESDTAVSSPPSTEPPPRVLDYGELAKTSPANASPDDESTPGEKPSATEMARTETAPKLGSETGKSKPAAAVVEPADPSNESKEAPTPMSAGAAIDPAVDSEVAAILAEYDRSSQEAAGQSFAGKLGLLNNQHRIALKRAEAEAGSKGESEAVMAIREEEESVRSTGDVRPGADLAKLPEAVRILRQTYVTERTKLEEARERGLAEPRQVAIAKLEKRLESATREGAQELAMTIRAAISNLGSAVNRSGSGESEHPTPPGFSLIPGGSFAMGRTSGDTDSNAPPITVTVSPFYIQQTETTKAQWDEVRTWAGNNGYTDLAVGGGKAANHPVQTVSWWDVVKWCNARSEKEGMTPVYTLSGGVMRTGTIEPTANWSANGYRLPTEAEWEKAARGGVSGKRFPWGTDTINHAEANYTVYSQNGTSNFYSYDAEPRPPATGNYHRHPSYGYSPVRSFGANGYGLYDMAGNVSEWCWDWYESSYYTTSNGMADPRGPASGSSRVFRGGAWAPTAFEARCGGRFGYAPGLPYQNFNLLGFRPARSAPHDAVPARSASVMTTPDAIATRSNIPNTMVQIPGGSFTMGRTSGDTDGDAPAVTVTVSSFYIQKTETTKAQWDEVRTWGLSNGYTDLAVGGGKASNHPVHSVNWTNAVKWCNARSEKEGLAPVYTISGSVMRNGTGEPAANWSANGYRLPTEAEWEKAARGGVEGKRFPSGRDTINHSIANYAADSSSSSYDSSGYTVKTYHASYAIGGWPYSSPVGSFPGNGYGLYDMDGNLWEWCWDWYGSSYYLTSSGASDPKGPSSGNLRVGRGGAWGAEAIYASCSKRGLHDPNSGPHNGHGFRPARTHLIEGMSLIPGGSFTMGRTSGDTDADAPPITVTVSPFYIQQTETTKAQWDEVRTWGLRNGYTDLAAGGGKASNHPVHSANWWDVVKWCNARSEKEGLTPVYTLSGTVMRTGTTEPVANWSANGYRLPTEAEWEKAARGGVRGKRFPWGTDTISHEQANYKVYSQSGTTNFFSYDVEPRPPATGTDYYHPSYTTGGFPYASPVGSFSANGYGLYDMAGSVWERCWDWYGANYYSTSAGTADPRGPASGTDRVQRGGSWSAVAIDARCSYRNVIAPANTGNYIGIRPARSATLDNIPVRSAPPDAVPARKVTPDAIPARSATPNTMVQIPGGSFTMGVTSGDTDADAPPITVTVSPFYIQQNETTKAQWDEVRTWGLSKGYTDLAAGVGKASNHPVHSVSWLDVVKWCNARSEKEGLTPAYTAGGAVIRTGTTVPDAHWTANGYRLPTEAEWEKAARGGVSGKRFPWGTDTISHERANYRYNGREAPGTVSVRREGSISAGTPSFHPRYAGGGTPYTSPVGSFAANGYGVYDMAGNVREWCWDWYGPSYGSTSNGTTDPRGPASGTDRVGRGGHWLNNASDVRCSSRGSNAPSNTSFLSGFRPARSSVP